MHYLSNAILIRLLLQLLLFFSFSENAFVTWVNAFNTLTPDGGAFCHKYAL